MHVTGTIGKVVIARQRFARVWGLGDRKSPVAMTPALVALEGDEIPIELSPFSSSLTSQIPASLSLRSNLPLSPPNFSENAPNWDVSLGHVLPPSMEEADAGEKAGLGGLLPISWQRMNFDSDLMNPEIDPQIIVLTDAPQLVNLPGKLGEALLTIKKKFPQSLIWTPGIAGPDNLPLLAWMGVDLFDLSRSRMACASNLLLDDTGPRNPNPELGEDSSMKSQLEAWRVSISKVRSGIKNGTLRSLVDACVLSSAKLVERLRRFDNLCSQQNGILSMIPSGNSFDSYSHNILSDPLVRDWEDFIGNRYSAPENMDKCLLLLPCSARKPYSLSKTHQKFRDATRGLNAHEVMVTSPLGLVPRDLEEVWPAAHYDIPVTGEWSLDEVAKTQELLNSLIKNNSYEYVIDHSGMGLEVQDVHYIDSRLGKSATSREGLDQLSAAVKQVMNNINVPKISPTKRKIDMYKSVARKNMLNDDWLNNVKLKGKPPRHKLEVNGKQIAQWNLERGGFSLAKASIPIMEESNSLRRIDIIGSEKLKGDIHINILHEYDSEIKAGEYFLIYQNQSAVGLGRAIAPAWEWAGTPGALAKLHQKL